MILPVMPATIVIPAHDEEQSLPSTLATLLAGLSPSVQVIVVCTGCSDRTAAAARDAGRVEVLEIEEASKVAALNAGDDAAQGFPRVYMDADILLTGTDAGRLIQALEAPGALSAEPLPVINSMGASLAVRAYYAVWVALHGTRPGDVGPGLYGLSKTGRDRFDRFPRLISDDGFVRAHFSPEELVRVEQASSIVSTPRTLGALIKIKARSRLGAIELAQRFPDLWGRKLAAKLSMRAKMLGMPLRFWPLLPLYVGIQLLARRRANRLVRHMDEYRWERDDSRE